jgi:chromosomal replication initiator protein
MNNEYTFDRFIVGEHNRFAVNCALAISKYLPPVNYNPFLIVGDPGSGKTHLIQAIGNYVNENSENKVIYTTAKNILHDFMQATQDVKMVEFKNIFSSTDVLLIDDIQFLQGKEMILGELYHTFNAFLVSKKQLVLTSDRPLPELKQLGERLLSLLEPFCLTTVYLLSPS